MEETHMKKEKDFVKGFSKELISRMVAKVSTRWPPDCTMFAYQPVRPQQEKAKDYRTKR